MRTLKVVTMSGAVYIVAEDGDVNRQETDVKIDWTNNGYQYTHGFLQPGVRLDDIAIGKRMYWMGIVNDYTEPVMSSLVVSIKEINDKETV